MDFQLPKLADTPRRKEPSPRWLKKAGEKVAKGEPLVEIETDKVNSELESPMDGVLTEIVVPEGETAAVGAVIARISGDGAGRPAGSRRRPRPRPRRRRRLPRASGWRRAGRRIAEADAESPAPPSPRAPVCASSTSRATRRDGSWTAYFVKALAAAAGKGRASASPSRSPAGWSSRRPGRAGRRSPAEISDTIADLAGRARDNRLEPAEVAGGEFTVTNLGGGDLNGVPARQPRASRGTPAPGAVRSDGHRALSPSTTGAPTTIRPPTGSWPRSKPSWPPSEGCPRPASAPSSARRT